MSQRKLVGVARALAARPRLLCLDEPAAGLDARESQELGARLRDLADQGQSMLLIEHDMGLVLGICDRVVVLEFGQVIAEGPPESVRQDPRVIAAYLGDGVTGDPGQPTADGGHRPRRRPDGITRQPDYRYKRPNGRAGRPARGASASGITGPWWRLGCALLSDADDPAREAPGRRLAERRGPDRRDKRGATAARADASAAGWADAPWHSVRPGWILADLAKSQSSSGRGTLLPGLAWRQALPARPGSGQRHPQRLVRQRHRRAVLPQNPGPTTAPIIVLNLRTGQASSSRSSNQLFPNISFSGPTGRRSCFSPVHGLGCGPALGALQPDGRAGTVLPDPVPAGSRLRRR